MKEMQKDGQQKQWMVERTIPIFEALMRNDPENHRIHAQLGYALLGKKEPDWLTAKAELSKAIELRDKSPDKGKLLGLRVQPSYLYNKSR